MGIQIYLSWEHLPLSGLEVGFEEVVEWPHVLLLGEEDMVRDVLHDLAHERQSALHTRRGLLVDDPRLARRYCKVKPKVNQWGQGQDNQLGQGQKARQI